MSEYTEHYKKCNPDKTNRPSFYIAYYCPDYPQYPCNYERGNSNGGAYYGDHGREVYG